MRKQHIISCKSTKNVQILQTSTPLYTLKLTIHYSFFLVLLVGYIFFYLIPPSTHSMCMRNPSRWAFVIWQQGASPLSEYSDQCCWWHWSSRKSLTGRLCTSQSMYVQPACSNMDQNLAVPTELDEFQSMYGQLQWHALTTPPKKKLLCWQPHLSDTSILDNNSTAFPTLKGTFHTKLCRLKATTSFYL